MRCSIGLARILREPQGAPAGGYSADSTLVSGWLDEHDWVRCLLLVNLKGLVFSAEYRKSLGLGAAVIRERAFGLEVEPWTAISSI